MPWHGSSFAGEISREYLLIPARPAKSRKTSGVRPGLKTLVPRAITFVPRRSAYEFVVVSVALAHAVIGTGAFGATDAGASTLATKRSCAKGLDWRNVSTAVEEGSAGAVKRPSDRTSIFAGVPSSTNAADFSIASRTFDPSRSTSWMNSENPSLPG